MVLIPAHTLHSKSRYSSYCIKGLRFLELHMLLDIISVELELVSPLFPNSLTLYQGAQTKNESKKREKEEEPSMEIYNCSTTGFQQPQGFTDIQDHRYIYQSPKFGVHEVTAG